MKLTDFNGLLLFCVPLVMQLAFFAALDVLQRQNTRAEARASHAQDVMWEASEIGRLALELQNGIRGYVISRNPVFLESYQNAKRLPVELAKLRYLVGDHPDQSARAESIAAAIAELQNSLPSANRLREAGQQEAIVARVQISKGKMLMDGVRRNIAEFLQEEDRLMAERRLNLSNTRRWILWIMACGSMLAMVFTGALLGLFTHRINARLKTLIKNARLLAAGKSSASAGGGPESVVELDRVLHDVAHTPTEVADGERQHSTELERRVAERTTELQRINRDLTQKNHENEMFVYSVSHDLRSPLVNLQGFSRELGVLFDQVRALLLVDGVPAAVTAQGLALVDNDLKRTIQFIQTAVRRLSSTIDSLLRLSRTGRVEYHFHSTDVESLVTSIVHSMAITVFDKGTEVKVHALPAVWGDSAAIEQVFANLIGNALNYLDPARPGLIEVGCRETADSQSLTFFVKDNGLGIPAEHQNKLFQAFTRLHPTAAPGEGIGLAIVRRVVERHGGSVWLESTVGVGSTFFVTLPIRPPVSNSHEVTDPRTQQRISQHGRQSLESSVVGK